MSKIRDLIKKMCPTGVKYYDLGKVCDIEKGEQLNKNLLSETGLYPVINGGIYPSGYWNEFNCQKNRITISQGGASAGYINYITTNFWAGAHCFVVEKCSEELLYKYVFHFLKEKEKQLMSSQIGAGIPSVSLKDINSLRIPIPPKEVQEEIVRILDKFTELEAELEARKNQYEFWRGKIINNSKGKNGKLIDLLSCPITDGPHTTPNLVDDGIPFISASAVYDGKVHLKDAQGFITQDFDDECAKKYKPKKWDVYMVKSGSTTGKVAIVDIDDNFNIWSPLAAMRTGNEITSRYLYHLLQTKEIQEQVKNRMSQGSQPNLSMRVLEQFNVKIPSFEEQKRIVNMLDKFDIMTNDITVGIPAEIELRRKQYEYYRNKLLSFEELSVNE